MVFQGFLVFFCLFLGFLEFSSVSLGFFWFFKGFLKGFLGFSVSLSMVVLGLSIFLWPSLGPFGGLFFPRVFIGLKRGGGRRVGVLF